MATDVNQMDDTFEIKAFAPFPNSGVSEQPSTGSKKPSSNRQSVSSEHQTPVKRYQAVSNTHQSLSKARSVSPLTRETISKTTPLMMLLLGILFMAYSWRGGITTVTDIYRFVYPESVSNTPRAIGLIIQLILTLGQMICSTKGWRRGYIIFLTPDALSTAWSLNRDFLIDLNTALIARWNIHVLGVYIVMTILSIFIGVYIARKGETFIIDNYRTLNN